MLDSATYDVFDIGVERTVLINESGS